MRLRISICIALILAACGAVGHAQVKGYWQAASNNAADITGDIEFSDTKLTIDFKAYVVAPIRSLKPDEVAAVFDADVNSAGTGELFRLSIPAAQRFLHKNTLCGTEDTQWVATYVTGKTLEVAFFSGESAPVFTFDAISHSPALCGTYTYVR